MKHKAQIYSPVANDQMKEPMFFGSPVNVARYDQARHEIFDKLTDRQASVFWREVEISVTKDKADFAKLQPHEQHIFIQNISYQILLDSVQGRGPVEVLLPICSNPQLETWIITWSYFESIHNKAYGHLIRNVFDDPSTVFDAIVPNQQIAKRAAAVTGLYDKLLADTAKWRSGELPVREAKKSLMLCMASINILEGVRFYVSFACSFGFAETSRMEANAKIIKLIARDETIHLAGTQHIFKLWREGRDDPEMAELYEELKPQIRQISLDASEQEKEWTEYLFKDGSMLGLNKKILDQYIEHITDKRLAGLGLEPEFGNPKNPIPWIDTWLSSSTVQTAPQESEITAYLTGSINTNLTENEFEGMEL